MCPGRKPHTLHISAEGLSPHGPWPLALSLDPVIAPLPSQSSRPVLAQSLVTPQMSSRFLEPQSNMCSKNKLLNPEPRKASQGGKVEGGGGKGLDGSVCGLLSLNSLDSVRWISASVTMDTGQRYESILRPYKASLGWEERPEAREDCGSCLSHSPDTAQKSSVYSIVPGPETEPGYAAD